MSVSAHPSIEGTDIRISFPEYKTHDSRVNIWGNSVRTVCFFFAASLTLVLVRRLLDYRPNKLHPGSKRTNQKWYSPGQTHQRKRIRRHQRLHRRPRVRRVHRQDHLQQHIQHLFPLWRHLSRSPEQSYHARWLLRPNQSMPCSGR